MVPTVDLVLLTAGRREYLARTLDSMQLEGVHIGRQLMVNDSGSPEFARYLNRTYPEWEFVHHVRNLGYSQAMRRTWQRVHATDGAPYVFWIEEDFEFERPVPVGRMVELIDGADPPLAQVVLLRRPFYARELEAGSIPAEHPESYTAKEYQGIPYLEHERFFSANPHLAKRGLFAHPWPVSNSSEALVGPQLVRMGYRFAYFGHGEPWVSHIGTVKAGKGY